MRFNVLDDWLSWQMDLHVNSIELGLERVSAVARELGIAKIAQKVITVAGTNGKGSTVAAYEHWLKNAGYSVATYTSPHLVRYNERIKINAIEVSDSDLCRAFEAIDQSRKDILLTYFEFGTLAALWLIQEAMPDYAVLEVGLGGRLDAVNIIDADMVHLTSIGIDHQAWLGNTREEIGFEKAGVLRKNIPVVANDRDLPISVQKQISKLDCRRYQLGQEFDFADFPNSKMIRWQSQDLILDIIPPMPGENQKQNIAGVVAGLNQLFDLSAVDSKTFSDRFVGAVVAGRFQLVDSALPAKTYLDVGHNEDAARALSMNLQSLKKENNRIIVVLGMLEDKNAADFVSQLKDVVDDWWLVSLTGDRGISCYELKDRVESHLPQFEMFESIQQLRQHALSNSSNNDIMLVAGSFLTVELFHSAMPLNTLIQHTPDT